MLSDQALASPYRKKIPHLASVLLLLAGVGGPQYLLMGEDENAALVYFFMSSARVFTTPAEVMLA